MKENKYLVSAIVSVYNCERFIKGCLDDLLSQTIADKVEIIIVNSGSQQNEESIIEECRKKHSNILYIRTSRETLYQAWNRGIKIATGKYITNANTDDRHRKDAFEIMVNALETDSTLDVVYADDFITEKENETFDCHTFAGQVNQVEFSIETLRYRCFLGPHPMWRKTIHDRYGYFDESLQVSGDYEFWLRIAEEGCKFKHIKDYLGLYLTSPYSLEHRDPRLKLTENEQIFKKYRDCIKDTKGLMDKIKVTLSQQWDNAGRFYVLQGDLNSARESFIRSIRYNFLNVTSLLGLAITFFPQMVINKLLFVKRLAWNWLRVL
jgi:glycosyltransferase involved in cell wall biosynthesis